VRLCYLAMVRPALHKVLPWLIAVGVVSSVLFSPSGLQAHSITELVHSSVLARLVLWTSWMLLSVPVALAAARVPQASYLRSLPVSRNWLYLALLSPLALVQLPWLVLFSRGSGLLSGASSAVLSLGLHLVCVAKPALRVLTLALVFAAVIVIEQTHVLGLLLEVLAIVFLLPAAWRNSTEHVPVQRSFPVLGPFPVALAVALIVSTIRTRKALILRSLALSGVGGLLLGAWFSNNAEGNVSSSLRVVVAFAAIPALFTSIPLAKWIGDGLSKFRWLSQSTGMTRPQEVFGAALGFSALCLPNCGTILFLALYHARDNVAVFLAHDSEV
jgi:hypothetical protein